MFALETALRDGAILAAAASAVVMGSLRANPRLFMRHFPEPLKQRLAPLSREETKAGAVVGVVLMALLFGGPLASALLAPPQPLPAVFLHAFTVGMVFNAVDWLVLDEFVLGVLKPRWALPPGSTMDDFQPFDHGRHLRGFVTGTAICALAGALAAGVVAIVR